MTERKSNGHGGAAGPARPVDLRACGSGKRDGIRARAHRLFRQGARGCDAARELGVQAATVCRWFRAFRAEECSMPDGERPRGAKADARRRLSPAQMEELRKALADGRPLDFSLPYRRWSYAAVAELVEAKFGLKISRVTAGSWLAMCRRE